MVWLAMLISIIAGGCGADRVAVEKYSTEGKGITVTASSGLAGAIDSVTFDGVEFLVAFDHGQGLQSAAVFDWRGEAYNPTEAGAEADWDKDTSTSQLLAVNLSGGLETQTQMAYWRPVDGQALSDHILSKRVTIIAPNTIQYDVSFSVPRDYRHGQFEVLTGYLLPSFDVFITSTGEPIDAGPGEQPEPLIFSNGEYAMGIYAPGIDNYGRHDYGVAHKWNAVYRQEKVTAGQYAFRCYVFVGKLEDVKQRMRQWILRD